MRQSLSVLSLDPGLLHSGSFPPLALTPEIRNALADHAPVAIGVSGGQDSTLTAYLVKAYLDCIGYQGNLVLVYCHLGLIEWQASLLMCQQLAQTLGLELVVLHTDLIARWQKRWQDNVARYRDLRCVKLIMPWSGPGLMRFCTSEMKVAPICQALVRRFPGQTILSVTGIRHDESDQRKHAPICQEQPRLRRARLNTSGFDWHPIVEWTLADVLAYHQMHALPRHQAYTLFGCSRVSCAWCVLGSRENLLGAAHCKANYAAYRQIVSLEVTSTFSFQRGTWLGDIAPHLHDRDTLAALAKSKLQAKRREADEARLPAHLLYQKGWPTSVPTKAEAHLLSEVRLSVAEAVGLIIRYTHPEEIRERYAELQAEQKHREATKLRKGRRGRENPSPARL